MVKTSYAFGLAVAGLTMLWGGAASAQAAGASAKRFSGNVSATASYSSNVAGGGDQVAAARNVTPGDVIYSALMSGAFVLPSKQETLFANGSVSINRHAQNANLDGQNYAASIGASGRAGPCSISLVGSYSRAQTPPTELLVAVTQNISESETASGALSCAAGAIVGSLSGNLGKSSNNAPGLIGTTSESLGASLGYGNANFGILSVTGSVSTSGFAQSPLPGQPTPSAPKQYGAGLSYSRKLGQRLNGSASVSYNTVDSGAGRGGHGISSSVAFNYALNQRANVSVGYSRQIQASQVIGSVLSRTQSLSLNGGYTLSQRIGLHASVSGNTEDNEGGVATISPLGFPAQVRQNRSLSEGVGASLRVGRNIAVSLNISHSTRTADVNQFNFTSNGVTLSISNSF
jgi:hypothetical protein